MADPPGGNRAGETYVIFGGSLAGTIDLNSTNTDLTILGDDGLGNGDMLGDSVAAGDINGDGVDDLIMGAPEAANRAGETYVVYGAETLPSTIDLNSTSSDLIATGAGANDISGRSVAAGDINGDGTDDLIIGAGLADPGGGQAAGEVYVIFGGDSLPGTISLATGADLTVRGDDQEDLLGLRAVAVGDINGDGTDDLIIGAHQADGPGTGTACGTGQVGDRCDAGEVYVIYGGSSLPSVIDLDGTRADITVYGDDAGDRSGNSVASGDIDGDTIDDLIIGASEASPAGRFAAGKTYVIYGGSTLPTVIDLDASNPDVSVFGGEPIDASGDAIAAGDINGDGVDDLVIGAFAADGSGAGTDCGAGQVGNRCFAGETYVIHGDAALPTSIDLSTEAADTTVFGDDTWDWSGFAVAVGDINGDGSDDLIIGARLGDGPGSGTFCGPGEVGDRCDAGQTYVIFGEPPPPTPTPTTTPTPTPCPPGGCPVGGIAELPDLARTPLDAVASSGSSAGVVAAAVAAVTAGAFALGGAAWYARRRWLR